MLGTTVNAAAIIVGGAIGLLLKERSSEEDGGYADDRIGTFQIQGHEPGAGHIFADSIMPAILKRLVSSVVIFFNCGILY